MINFKVTKKVKMHFLLLLLFHLIPSFLRSETVLTFEPLRPYEQLAYQWRRGTSTTFDTLNLYAQDMQSLFVTRRIGSVSLFRWQDLMLAEFTNNRRDLFYSVPTRGPEGSLNRHSIYHLKGDAGTIMRVFPKMLAPFFVLSNDGRKVLVTDIQAGRIPPYYETQKEAIFFLYCTETWELLHEFHWAIREAISVGGFSLRRTPNGIFTILYVGFGHRRDGVYAVATIDPESGKFEVLWDRTRPEDWIGYLGRTPQSRDFPDHRGAHQHDRTLNLEEVIFAPTPQANTRTGTLRPGLTQEWQDNNTFLFIILGVAGILFLGITIIIFKMRKKV